MAFRISPASPASQPLLISLHPFSAWIQEALEERVEVVKAAGLWDSEWLSHGAGQDLGESGGFNTQKMGPKTCAENVGAKSNLKIDKYRNFILKISWFHYFDGSKVK